MTKDELNNDYFRWMCRLVSSETYSKRLSYQKLLHCLHDTKFFYIIAMDGNRAEDGIDLRYRFGYKREYERLMITTYLTDRDCSVLEMLVALAIRCEEHIMDDPDIGNRTGQWFWSMIVNLGLKFMNDKNYNKAYTDKVIFKFLNRAYEPNGDGGLFTIANCKYDLREVEIWYQMCWYLADIIT